MKLLSLLLCLGLVACAPDTDTPYSPVGIIAGDSVMASLPLESYQGAALENRAVGGTHCDDAVADLITQEPTALVILGCGHNGSSLDEDIMALEMAIGWCALNCGQLIILNVNPVYIRPTRAAKITSLNLWLDQQPVTVLDFYSWSVANQTTEMFHDGLHPTVVGYERLIEELFNTGEIE